MRDKLDALLGAIEVSAVVVASAHVERTTRGFSARLVVEVGEHRSERTLTASQCVALAEATALVVAVTMDPAALDAALVSETPADSPEAPSVTDVPEPAPPPEIAGDDGIADAQPAESSALAPLSSAPESPRRSPPRIAGVHARVFGHADYGALPGVSGAIGAVVGAHGRGFRFEAGGSWTFAREASVRSLPSARGRIALWSIAARACGVPQWGRIELPLCGGVEAGALEARGVGATVHQTDARRSWIAVTAGPALAIVPVPRVAILVGADLVVPLWRARFVIGDEVVHRPFYVGVRAGLGVELRFGVSP